jgi:uncharacterized protein (TIGR03083 family)
MQLGEYLPTLRTTNARMDDAAAEALLAHGWSARVPGCPDWRLADLVRHVAGVQRFWAWVVRTRATDPGGYPEPSTHPDDELLGWLDAQHAELEGALAGADPLERVWTWAEQQDVAFVLRRQLHEAVVHTVDVEQVLGDIRPVPTAFGLDGLDEWLQVIVPATLPDGPPPGAHPVTFHAVDAGVERTLFPGSRPFPIAALSGTAGELLLSVWRRVPLEVLTVEGDGLQAEAMIDLVQKGSR